MERRDCFDEAEAKSASSRAAAAFQPIASTSGAPICSLSGGSATQGCIAIFTSTANDAPIPLGKINRG